MKMFMKRKPLNSKSKIKQNDVSSSQDRSQLQDNSVILNFNDHLKKQHTHHENNKIIGQVMKRVKEECVDEEEMGIINPMKVFNCLNMI